EISPFLLISEPPAKWPSPYGGKSISFNTFRMPDAQDLPRIYDTFSSSPLSKKFAEAFRSQREQRNAIMHSTGKDFRIQATEIVEVILFSYSELCPNESWLGIRRDFLKTGPAS
ncbi:hypothetical protein QN408_25140, partial [Pseudomonas sp. CCI4.2]|nr:hypothetical protein [Pseudomonas sp. CCI4.2]